MAYNNILFEKDETGIVKITLNQPDKLNALSTPMAQEMKEALQQANIDNEIKVIIITGTGRAFCAGGDIKTMEKGLDVIAGRDYVKTVSGVTELIYKIEKPVIAAVNGFAVGAGFNLAVAADFVLASSDAKFGQAFLQVGLVPDIGGTYFLPRITSMIKAKDLVFTGRMIDAAEAERIGLVTRVFDPDVFQEGVCKFAAELAHGPSCAMGLAKLLLNNSINITLDQSLENEAYAQSICMQTDDHREGLRAFMEKRKPNFTGK